MNKRKRTSISNRKRTSISNRKRKMSYSLRSNDSGVSVTVKDKIEPEKNTEITDEKATSPDLKGFPNYEHQHSDQEYSLASVLQKNQLNFIEDEDCLDYEPYDDDVLNASLTLNKENCGDLMENNDNKTQNDSVQMFDFDTTLLDPNFSCPPCTCHSTFKCGSALCTYRNEDMAREEMNEQFQTGEENFNMDNQIEEYDDNHILYEDDEQLSRENVLDDAQIDFKGPLNITITRPVLNNTSSEELSKNSLDTSIHPDLSTFVKTNKNQKVKILNISTINPEEKNREKEDLRKKLSNSRRDKIKLDTLREDKVEYDNNRFSNSSATFNFNREEHIQVSEKEELINRWLMHSDKDELSDLLDSLCESHFSYGCKDVRCTKTHSLEEIKKRILQANFQDFNKLYGIVLTKEIWFMCLFDTFLSCFTSVPKMGEIMLVNMIEDVYKVFSSSFTDKTTYIVEIVEGLRKMGLTFKEAIENIISKYGTSQLWICDIMLFLIAKESDLVDHWCLVSKLTSCRCEKIDNEVVSKFLMSPFNDYPPNKDLCKKIYQDILAKDLVDLNKVNKSVCEMITKISRENIQNTDMYSPHMVERNYNQGMNHLNDFIPEQQDALSFDGSSDTYSVKNISVIEEEGDYFNEEMSMKEDASASSGEYSPRRTENEFGRDSRIKVVAPSDNNCSRKMSEKVMNKLVSSLNIFPKPQSPANIIAHPSCQPNISPDYNCNLSLHNLFPNVYSCATDVSAEDIRRLTTALTEADAAAFLDVLETYSDQYAIENFVVNVFTVLKSIKKAGSSVYSAFMALLNALEENDGTYMNKTYVKVSIEVVALNLIYMFYNKGHAEFCRNILLKMKDWHNLVTSKIFLKTKHSDSHMRRYIFIMKVLISAGDFSWVNELFQAKVLNLLGHSSVWPYKCKLSDIEARNEVLLSFFDKGFSGNIFIVNDLLKSVVLMHGGLIDGCDLWTWFDNKIVSLIDNGETKSVLMLLHNDISNYYERYMDKYVLQAYMLHMEDSVRSEEALKLFELCCSKGVYHKYSGEEPVIYITTNLTNFEIGSLLHCYFRNFKTGNIFFHDFHIELLLPEYSAQESAVLKKYRTNRNVYNVFETICIILKSKYKIIIQQPIQSRIYVSQTMLFKSLNN